MIVKNESHIIETTLENLCSQIKFSYWVISDTGSTDNTKEIINGFFEKKGIKGELVEHDWKDFGHNRSVALASAYNKSDYVLSFDADDRLLGKFVLPSPMNHDKYNLIIGTGFSYVRPLLFNNRLRWKFVGVLHEYLECIDQCKTEQTIYGNYNVESNRLGFRSKNVNKYLDDAKVLEKAFAEENGKNNHLAWRYAFYCAQSYKDCNRKDDSIKWYEKVLSLGNWSQEKYYSCLMLAIMNKEKGNFDKALKYFLKSIEYDDDRFDGIIFASELLRLNESHVLVNLLYNKYKNYNRDPKGKLFLFKEIHENYTFEFNNFLSSCSLKSFDSAYECAKKILLNCTDLSNFVTIVLSNLVLCKDYIQKDSSGSLELFRKVDDLIHRTSLTNQDTLNQQIYDAWTMLYESNKGVLTQNKNFSFNNKNKKNPVVFLSFTTCKRYDLFTQTINSILNHWTDVSKIDYWFCVDDNSSAKHRKNMKREFSWIDYHFKNESEKGHLKSMNIIHDKLRELKPTYWIHMEDDFLFHHKGSYVERSIKALEKLKSVGVRQVLFNKNYGETIKDYNIKGCEKVGNDEDELAIHVFKQGQFPYPNCHYWPYYSFRPSMISVKEILEIGNYDTTVTFFEMEYAKKYFLSGYKSAFFNRITNTHIGRLTSERFDKTKLNAYQLNQTEQFNKEDKVESKKVESKKNYSIKIVNLEKRTDRKQNVINEFTKAGFDSSEYEFVKATDGKELKLTKELYNLFRGNDFGNRKGVIGCALSHYNLWKQLLEDKNNTHYVIFEDDFKLCSDFKKKFECVAVDCGNKDFLFFGYHMHEELRKQVKDVYDVENVTTIRLSNLNNNLYIGGYFSYSISKDGATKLVKFIEKYGIRHGIDYLNKIFPELSSYEIQPCLVHSVWNENNKQIDSNIQFDFEKFDFSEYENEEKEERKLKIKNGEKNIKVKMLCNWCSSEELCKRWSNMCENQDTLTWKNIELVSHSNIAEIDYFVIINNTGEYFIPSNSIVFQMEPWVYDETKNWGVKTWGNWSEPDKHTKNFLHVNKHKTNLNGVQWEIPLTLTQIARDFDNSNKQERISIVCSQKNADVGHILRNNFIRYIENNNKDNFITDKLDIYGKGNYHSFKFYKGPLENDDKSTSLVGYKYHISGENNAEYNYATEKIWEPILCETLCFYYGCPNLEDYIDSDAFVRLDFNDMEGSMKIIETAIKEDWWSKRIDSIRKAKKKIIEELAFFPTLQKIISNK